jgi:putative transposase
MIDDELRGHALRKGRYSVAGRVYFITTNVIRRQPLLVPPAREVIIGALRWSRDQGRLWLLGYTIMDDHFHTLFMLREGYSLSKLLDSLKTFTAREINRQRGQAGEFWQEGFHDHAIRDAGDFNHHLNYIHENPVRREWVERADDYAWSTAHPARQGDIDWHALGYDA